MRGSVEGAQGDRHHPNTVGRGLRKETHWKGLGTQRLRKRLHASAAGPQQGLGQGQAAVSRSHLSLRSQRECKPGFSQDGNGERPQDQVTLACGLHTFAFTQKEGALKS